MSLFDSNPKNSGKASYALPIAIFLLLVGGMGVWFARSSPPQSTNSPTSTPSSSQQQATTEPQSLEPATNWQANNHVHGLAVHPENPQLIYLASHHGLLKRAETGEWFWLEPEQERADYMGFTTHPTDPSRFYASGHPQEGGNLGFQVTANRGQNWTQLSMPGVDFHALVIAPSNPDVFYGWAVSGKQGLFASTDGGNTWTKTAMVGLGDAPFNLAVDPLNPDRLFAATRSGLYESTDGGDNWLLVANTQEAPLVGLDLFAEGERTVMVGYRFLESAPGLYRSADGGKTWEQLGSGTEGVILHVAIAPDNNQVIYAVSDKNALFQSQDGGETWNELI